MVRSGASVRMRIGNCESHTRTRKDRRVLSAVPDKTDLLRGDVAAADHLLKGSKLVRNAKPRRNNTQQFHSPTCGLRLVPAQHRDLEAPAAQAEARFPIANAVALHPTELFSRMPRSAVSECPVDIERYETNARKLPSHLAASYTRAKALPRRGEAGGTLSACCYRRFLFRTLPGWRDVTPIGQAHAVRGRLAPFTRTRLSPTAARVLKPRQWPVPGLASAVVQTQEFWRTARDSGRDSLPRGAAGFRGIWFSPVAQ